MAKRKNKVEVRTEPIDLYCHIACNRPRDKNYGLFNATFTKDIEGKETVVSETHKRELWKNDQYVTAIQNYEFALYLTHKYQVKFKENLIGNIFIVTDNSILQKWIEDPYKNEKYSYYMRKAIEKYRQGEPKALVINVGMYKGEINRTAGHKYCKEKYVENNREFNRNQNSNTNYTNKLSVSGVSIEEMNYEE